MVQEDGMEKARQVEETALAALVRRRLVDLGMRQSDFCRLTGFDQGLLSKIHGSIITNVSLESALRLALGLQVQPTQIFELIGRQDFHDLVLKTYSKELTQ